MNEAFLVSQSTEYCEGISSFCTTTIPTIQELINPDALDSAEDSNLFLVNNFSHSFLQTDQVTFTRTGAENIHNTHIWVWETPHTPKPNSNKHQVFTKVQAGGVVDNIMGPYFFPQRLNHAALFEILNNILFGLLDEISVELGRNMQFQRDKCPAHYSKDVGNWMDQIYLVRRIGRSGLLAQPAWSPDPSRILHARIS